MEFKIYDVLSDKKYTEQIHELLELADCEFVPPLSARSSATQSDLKNISEMPEGIGEYFKTISEYPFLLAVEGDMLVAFMSFRYNYICEYICKEYLPNIYVSTTVVKCDYRGRGIMEAMYRTLLQTFPKTAFFTRTWHTNKAHLHVLDKMGFSEYHRLENHRGEGIDTVYYRRLSEPQLPEGDRTCSSNV